MFKLSNYGNAADPVYSNGPDDLTSTLDKLSSPPVDPVKDGVVISDTEITDSYDPISPGAATGEAANKVDQKKKEEDLESDPLSTKSTVVQDACVVIGLAALAVAAAVFSAPLVVTVGLAAMAVAATVDIVSHRVQGDDSSFISRPGSVVRTVAVGVGAAVATVGGVGAVFAGVSIGAVPSLTVEDDGSTIVDLKTIREKLKDWRTWIFVVLAAIIPYMFSRNSVREAVDRKARNAKGALRIKFRK